MTRTLLVLSALACVGQTASAQSEHAKHEAILIPLDVSDDVDICIERNGQPKIWCFTVGELRAAYRPTQRASLP